jgi:hypothetical protein
MRNNCNSMGMGICIACFAWRFKGPLLLLGLHLVSYQDCGLLRTPYSVRLIWGCRGAFVNIARVKSH